MDGNTNSELITQLKRIADALEGIEKELELGSGSYLSNLIPIQHAVQDIAAEQKHRGSGNA